TTRMATWSWVLGRSWTTGPCSAWNSSSKEWSARLV
ncbi:uncharacterized protein METZ01_LOCUS187081, partial [marine metagenome]